MKILGYSRNISGNASILLDSLRILAASTVFFRHFYDLWNFPLSGHNATVLDNFSHAAVVVFFVLSGYLIAFTTTSNKRGKLQYAKARLSRLYSVVAPALLVTAVAQVIIFRINSDLYLHYTRGASWPRFIFSGLFINEIWFFSAAPPINGPLWSLSYEFWYYVIFGLFFYKGKGVKQLIIPVVACLIAGPKILLMMPIWLAGNFSYRLKRPDISSRPSWVLIFLVISAAISLICFLPLLPNPVGTKPLFWAAQFITDWIVGVFFALALWLLPQEKVLRADRHTANTFFKNFRKLADLTFPLYVLHDPLLVLCYALLGGASKHSGSKMWLGFFLVLGVCLLIGNYLEKKRYLWSAFFEKLLFQLVNRSKKINTYIRYRL